MQIRRTHNLVTIEHNLPNILLRLHLFHEHQLQTWFRGYDGKL
jgi:hypothetical protein